MLVPFPSLKGPPISLHWSRSSVLFWAQVHTILRGLAGLALCHSALSLKLRLEMEQCALSFHSFIGSYTILLYFRPLQTTAPSNINEKLMQEKIPIISTVFLLLFPKHYNTELQICWKRVKGKIFVTKYRWEKWIKKLSSSYFLLIVLIFTEYHYQANCCNAFYKISLE